MYKELSVFRARHKGCHGERPGQPSHPSSEGTGSTIRFIGF